jgi:hypothetical protein
MSVAKKEKKEQKTYSGRSVRAYTKPKEARLLMEASLM